MSYSILSPNEKKISGRRFFFREKKKGIKSRENDVVIEIRKSHGQEEVRQRGGTPASYTKGESVPMWDVKLSKSSGPDETFACKTFRYRL